MEVNITSEELIKPSLPTPQQLRTYKFSLLNQNTPAAYAQVILFYFSNSEPDLLPRIDVPSKLELLKKSLGQTLARFYPLAGKKQDDFSIECDDKGSHFIEKTTHFDHTGNMVPLLVGELRRALAKIDSDFVLGLRHDKNLMRISLEKISKAGSSKNGVDIFSCSSWCKFGLYDADFGWGRPIWAGGDGLCWSSTMFLNANGTILVDTRFGDGIEAWVTLDEQRMTLLEEDPEFRSFASGTPSPLIISDKP
ncbi:hypothetical protein CRG98_047262 [Punica granatum]|uniref:Stemmadenine O-acetyltransferase-like n=1 Tax=Punica granatum TaxID=22663 RepID=A0A2I0HKU4_PUNGR|nr:hypothetical protein CRG98_047262 [Punica granatum]